MVLLNGGGCHQIELQPLPHLHPDAGQSHDEKVAIRQSEVPKIPYPVEARQKWS